MVTLMINLEQQVTEGLNKIITELKQRLRERKAELGANHTQEAVVSVLGEISPEGIEADAIGKVLGILAYINPKKTVPRSAIVYGVLVKLIGEGVVKRGNGLHWVLVERQSK